MQKQSSLGDCMNDAMHLAQQSLPHLMTQTLGLRCSGTTTIAPTRDTVLKCAEHQLTSVLDAVGCHAHNLRMPLEI